jgi:MerR family transcriptional regulator, repressor of the yfmOP operon
MTETSQQLARIGKVAEQVGVTARTIRYYEELGLLGDAGDRVKGQHRLFTQDDVARLHELVRLRDLLGLSLDELTELAEAAQVQQCLRSRWEASTGDAERAQIVRTAIPNVQRQLELLHTRQRHLAEFAAELNDKLDRMYTLLTELDQRAHAEDTTADDR